MHMLILSSYLRLGKANYDQHYLRQREELDSNTLITSVVASVVSRQDGNYDHYSTEDVFRSQSRNILEPQILARPTSPEALYPSE